METRFKLIKCSLACIFVSFVMLSCGENSQKTKDNADESFRNALRDNLSDVATTNEIAKRELDKAEAEAHLKMGSTLELSEQEPIEQNPAPYGYDEDGVPYPSLDHKKLDEAFEKFSNARDNYLYALNFGDPMNMMFNRQTMKREIEKCVYYAKNIGDTKIIEMMKGFSMWVDNLQY